MSSGRRPAILSAVGVRVRFGDAVILDDVDLALAPGRTAGVVGPNGAGKSTLVRVLSRTLAPESGRIALAGRDLSAWRPGDLARLLAVVPQTHDLPPGFTGEDVVMMGRTPFLGWLGRETERDRTVVRAAMIETDTWHLAARRTHQLSGGERQRLVVARALAQEPRVLLADEPTAHLDINHQTEVVNLVRQLVDERGIATLVIWHDLNLAARFCDELLLLRSGRVLARGTPDDVLTESRIEEAYGARVTIVRHPDGRSPVVLPA